MNIQLAILIGYILLLGVVSWFAVKIQNRGGGGSMLRAPVGLYLATA